MPGKGVVRRLAEAWAGFARWYRRRQEALREFLVELRELAPWLRGRHRGPRMAGGGGGGRLGGDRSLRPALEATTGGEPAPAPQPGSRPAEKSLAQRLLESRWVNPQLVQPERLAPAGEGGGGAGVAGVGGRGRPSPLAFKRWHNLTPRELGQMQRIFRELAERLPAPDPRPERYRRPTRRVDPRRTFRRNLRHMLPLRIYRLTRLRERPRPRPYRLLLIGDVSHSMAHFSVFILNFFYYAQRAFDDVRAFLFSNAATDVTPYLGLPAFAQAVERIQENAASWEEGTWPSVCLKQILAQPLDLDRNTLAFLISDGDFADDPREEILAIRARVAQLIWLRPSGSSQARQVLPEPGFPWTEYVDREYVCANVRQLEQFAADLAAEMERRREATAGRTPATARATRD